jgi:hypothetical protein
MKLLSISISDKEMNKYGIKKDRIPFSELIEIVSIELMRQTLERSVRLAGKQGLDKMTMNQISNEVKSVRKNA